MVAFGIFSDFGICQALSFLDIDYTLCNLLP
jgi:hypothetical protein